MNYEKGFNSYVLQLFLDFYDIKSNSKYSYKHTIGNNLQYTYSEDLVNFIFNEIKKDPQNIVESLKKSKR